MIQLLPVRILSIERNDEGQDVPEASRFVRKYHEGYVNANRRSFERYNGEEGDRHSRHSRIPEEGQLDQQH